MNLDISTGNPVIVKVFRTLTCKKYQSQLLLILPKYGEGGYFLRDSMMPRHLSANWQYCRHAADGSGRFHSAPQLGQVVLSSSLQISNSPLQTWQLM
jgi:hypothetical protein